MATQDESARIQPSRKHRKGLTRIAAACERCRTRKTKCDGKYPVCGSCEASQESCIPSERLIVRQEGSSEAVLRSEIRHLRAQVTRLNQQLSEARRTSAAVSETTVPDGSRFTYPHHDQRTPDGSVGSQYGPKNPCYVGRILRPTFGIAHQNRVDAGDKSSAWSLWKDDHSAETPVEHSSIDEATLRGSYGLSLVDIFFDQRWPHVPILHRPSFIRECFEPFANDRNLPGILRFQLFMVFAIAALEQGRNQDTGSYSHRDLFDMAVQDLTSVLVAEDFDCITALVLLLIYGRTEPQSVNMWHTTGLALRIAIGMDLHRAESIRNMDLKGAELSKRLFWCIYAYDRSMSIYLGRPLGIQDADITMPYPLQLTDDDLENQTTSTVQPRPRADVKDMSTFTHLIKLRKINSSIYSIFHSINDNSGSGADLDAIRQEIYSQLSDWLITSPRYPVSRSMFQSPEWFQTAYHLAVIALHRPSFAQPQPTSESLKICADSGISLVSCYSSLYAKNKVSYSFVALSAIFLATITMLYSLRASPQVRKDLTRQVIEININSSLQLIRGIAGGREVAERAAEIIQRLGNSVLSLFDNEGQTPPTANGDARERNVDREFLSWFGLKSRMKQSAAAGEVLPSGQWNSFDAASASNNMTTTTLDVDFAWQDLFQFGMDNSTGMDFSGF